jgi:hypothetical protein
MRKPKYEKPVAVRLGEAAKGSGSGDIARGGRCIVGSAVNPIVGTSPRLCQSGSEGYLSLLPNG